VDPIRRELVESLFEELLEVPRERRGHLLELRCAGDGELQREVLALLMAHDRAEGILETPTPAAALLEAPGLSTHMGPYRIVGELGEGGMGVVLLGERDDGQFRLQVAIKLLQGGVLSGDLLRRFSAERQILASLDHPNIARLLDGGVTPEGRPYLVMEYVQGLPLDRYCDRNRLSVTERLRLFCQVCRAVHHAHRNLVVHRDLKPSNILVTGEGVPKLLDFGIAKLLDPAAAGLTGPLTRTGLRLMTPEYSSPEQVRGEGVTTANDIWTLGVILYELLTGHRPFALEGRSPAECERILLNQDPPRPSTVVLRPGGRPGDRWEDASPHAGARARGTSPERLRRALSGELDRIVLMALRKEPERRYASAEQMAQDVERHLNGEPVLAHGDARLYRLGKFVRRHRVETAAGVLLAASLLAGAVVSTRQAALVRVERDRAETALLQAEDALGRSEDVTTFLLGLFEASSPDDARGDTVRAGELLRRGLEQVDALADRPEVQGRLLDAVGRVYGRLGEYGRARPLLERALATQLIAHGELHPEVVLAMENLASLVRASGRYEEAEGFFREALETAERVHGPEHPVVGRILSGLGRAVSDRALWAESEEIHARALRIREGALGPDHPETVQTLVTLAALARRQGRLSEAERGYREVLAIRRRVLGDGHPETAESMSRLAGLLHDELGGTEEALALTLRALEIQRLALGERHPAVASTLSQLAGLQAAREEWAAAEAGYREALAIRRGVYGDRSFLVAETMGVLADFLAARGRFQESMELHREEIQVIQATAGRREHSQLGGALHALALVHRAAGDLQGAVSLLREAVEVRATALGWDHPLVATSGLELARVLRSLGRDGEVGEVLQEVLESVAARYPPDHYRVREVHAALANHHEKSGNEAEALLHRERAAGVPSPLG